MFTWKTGAILIRNKLYMNCLCMHIAQMGWFCNILFFLCAITFHLSSSTAQVQFTFRTHACVDSGDYSANSAFSTNLNIVLSSLSANASRLDRFYNTTAGLSPGDRVYGIFLCRGDTKPQLCQDCVKVASEGLVNRCPNQKEAIIWFDVCMVRYANRAISSTMEQRPRRFAKSPTAIRSDSDEFNRNLGDLMDRLVTRAVSGSPQDMFANESVKVGDFRNLYGLVQCTPDISQHFCNVCLRYALGDIPACCGGREGGRVLAPSCTIRYESGPFFETDGTTVLLSPPVTSSWQPPINPTIPPGKGISTPVLVVLVIVPVVLLLTLMAALTCAFARMKKPKVDIVDADENEDASNGKEESLRFDFVKIRAATNDFCDANKLGQGGFGPVYRGRLSNGQEIAVKRMMGNCGQGEIEFKNEIVLMARLQHKNLVRLQGFCLEGRERLLIYEFLPNASLDHFIFDPVRRLLLDWGRRYKIIIGIARGILYLHEDCPLRIIHHDLKAGNILLDGEMNPKISDFGMARLFAIDQSKGITKRIAGTFGYMAPEYVKNGQFSVKTDVFSFGVLTLEIISGKKISFHNLGEIEHLLSYAWKNWRNGSALNLMDPVLRGSSLSEIMKCIHIGLLCVQENVAKRPTIASVILMLNEESACLPLPSKPGFFMPSGTKKSMLLQEHYSVLSESDKSSVQTVHQSVNEASITELNPR